MSERVVDVDLAREIEPDETVVMVDGSNAEALFGKGSSIAAIARAFSGPAVIDSLRAAEVFGVPPPIRINVSWAEIEAAGWRAKTPRSEAEARAMLAEVEPRGARCERDAHLGLRSEGATRLRGDTPIEDDRGQTYLTLDEWRPRATRHVAADGTVSWSIEGGWLDEHVPDLCALVPYSMATVATPMRPRAGVGTEARASLDDRYASQFFLDAPSWIKAQGPQVLDVVLIPLSANGWEHLVSDIEEADGIGIAAVRDHAGPHDVPRGWCPTLNPGAPEASESELRLAPMRTVFP